MEGANAWGELASWAQKAKKAVVEQAQATYEQVQQSSSGDLEIGVETGANQLASWAFGAADRAKSGLTAVGTKAWQGDLAQTLGKASENAARVGTGFSEAAKANAALVAGSAKDRLATAGSSLSGIGSLAMSPGKLLQFAGIFMLGLFLVSLSFSFLPLLPINPAKFALLFALGSVTMLGSVASLKGPQAFLGVAMQRDKLPFSISYAAGLIGTFWATLVARSYLFTGVFAFLQFVGLLYFLASFVPGGKSILNFFGRLSGRGMRMVFKGGVLPT